MTHGSHGESIYGYDSLMTLVPNTNIGVYTAVTGHDDHDIFQTCMHLHILDILHEEPQWITSNFTCSYSTQHTSAGSRPTFARGRAFPRSLPDYVGTYNNLVYGDVKITVVNDKLKMHYGFAEFDVFYSPSSTDEKTITVIIESVGIAANIIVKGKATFKDTDNISKYDKLIITDFEEDQPPTFVRV